MGGGIRGKGLQVRSSNVQRSIRVAIRLTRWEDSAADKSINHIWLNEECMCIFLEILVINPPGNIMGIGTNKAPVQLVTRKLS
jgi:hypothetical protein